jgi:hypothetical protein
MSVRETSVPGLRHHLAVSLIALALPCSAIAATHIRPILPERLKLSPAERRKLLLADLNATLTGPTSPTTITTRPYLSSIDGLCRRDVLQLAYIPAGDGTNGHGPLRPRGIDTLSRQYHFLGLEGERTPASMARWQAACAGLSGDKVYWAHGGDDDRRADDALVNLKFATDAVRDHQAIKIDCTDLEGAPKDLNCPSEFTAAAANIGGFIPCDGRPQTRDCYLFFSDRYQIELRSDWSTNKQVITIRMSYPDVVGT